MSTDIKRLTIYGRVDDGSLYSLGWFELPVGLSSERFGGEIASALHRLGWYYEEQASRAFMMAGDVELRDEARNAGVEDSGDNRATPEPRRASYMGLVFWEVAPDEFVLSTDWDTAIKLYGNVTQYNAKQIKRMYPAAIWENL